MPDLLRSTSSVSDLSQPVERSDLALVALIDALVESIDLGRCWEVDRLRSALEPFGGIDLFDAEIRLRGIASADTECICGRAS